MRLLFWILTLCCLQFGQAFAYVEDTNADDAEMSAGDQNTNLFRMHSEGDAYIKKFKEINQIIDRQTVGSSFVDTTDIDRLYRNDQRSAQEKEIDVLLAEVEKNTQNIKELKTVPSHEIYAKIATIRHEQVYDADVAATILTEIRRAGK